MHVNYDRGIAMKIITSTRFVAGISATAITLGLCFTGVSAAGAAESTPRGVLVAQETIQQVAFSAQPTAPGVISVTTEPGSKVRLTAKKTKTNKAISVTKSAGATGKLSFTKLIPGTDYTVTAPDGTARVRALSAVNPTKNLTVRSTAMPDAVELSWNHSTTRATGGADIEFTIEATNAQGETMTQPADKTVAIMTGLDPDAIYTFTVTPHNAMGPGAASKAKMTMTLRSLSSTDQTDVQESPQTPVQKPTPAPKAQSTQPAPGPAPVTPSTRTIFVCPSDYSDNGSTCQKTQAYTYSNLAYTYHTEVTNLPYTFHTVTTGPAPIINSFETQDVCPSGYNLENYGAQGKLCRLYGAAPTAQIKDNAPSGFTDNGSNYTKSEQVKDQTPPGYTDTGSQWQKKDAAPAGYSDNGSEYIATTNKISVQVAA
jgi:hypothetical protein